MQLKQTKHGSIIHYAPDLERIEQEARNGNLGMMILSSPHNPTRHYFAQRGFKTIDTIGLPPSILDCFQRSLRKLSLSWTALYTHAPYQ